MYSVDNNVYSNYIDCFLNNLYKTFNNNIKFKINSYYSDILTNVKFYLNLLTFKSNEILYYSFENQYLNYNNNSYYSINIPIKINFNNFKYFYINYNLINIPKIHQAGDILLNGYCRIPILYVKLVTKTLYFKFNKKLIIKHLVRLQNHLNLYINIYDDNIKFYLNSYEINNNLFNIYNNIKIKNKYINFTNLEDILYILNIKKHKKYKLFTDIIFINKFLYNNLYLEIFSLFSKFINIKFNKKHTPNNDNFIHKLSDSILGSIFKIFTSYITFYDIVKFVENKEENIEVNKSFSTILFKENLLTNPLLHYTNQLNIIAYLTNKFKINMFGYSNFSKNKFNVSKGLRKIHSDYIGIINVLNTPDGDTCGLISLLANNTVYDKFKLKLLSNDCDTLENFSYIDITSKNLNNIIISDFSYIKRNKFFKIKTVEILENNKFKIINLKKTSDNKTLSILNTLSASELIIPFLFNNDPCRSLMGSRMHTQSIPLLYSYSPYVTTKYNTITNLASSRCVYSLYNGLVIKVSSTRITILDDQNRAIYSYLHPFSIIDYNSLIRYKPTVVQGDRVYIGKILAVPNDLNNLEFTLGFNNFVNYSFYDGYEHEDAIVLNKNLVIEDILTSISFNIYEDSLFLKDSNYIELLASTSFKYEDYIEEKEENCFNNYCEYMLSEKKLMSKIRYELSDSKSIKFINLFKLLFTNNKKLSTNLRTLKISLGGEGRLIKYEILSGENFKRTSDFYKDKNIPYMMFRFFVFKIDKIKLGDKLCGRYGNKGVISKITDTIDLPYTFYDISPYCITSPIGALARINLGQFLDGLCGYKSMNDNCRIKAPINLYNSCILADLYVKMLLNHKDIHDNFNLDTVNINYLRDFKTGYKLKNFNLLSIPYYLKLMHTSKNKFHYRTVGGYSYITQQPVHGKDSNGGQKFGEMEVWALEAHGSSYNLRELALLKTNIITAERGYKGYSCSESFKTLSSELKNILINITKETKYKFY